MDDRRKLVNRREVDKKPFYDVESFQRIYKVWDRDSEQDIPYPWPPRGDNNWPRYAERLQSHCAGFDLLVTKRDEQIKQLVADKAALMRRIDRLKRQVEQLDHNFNRAHSALFEIGRVLNTDGKL